jgi:hypothetical protein
MFPVRYELNLYILFRENSVFKGLIHLPLLNRSLGFSAGLLHVRLMVDEVALGRVSILVCSMSLC